MSKNEFVVTRPEDFREYWGRVLKIVERCEPEVQLEKS